MRTQALGGAPFGRGDTLHCWGSCVLCSLYSPLAPAVGPHCDTPTMRTLLSTLWLALACSSVHTTLSKSDAKKAASKTLLEKVGMLWELASSRPLESRVVACDAALCGTAQGCSRWPEREQLLAMGLRVCPPPLAPILALTPPLLLPMATLLSCLVEFYDICRGRVDQRRDMPCLYAVFLGWKSESSGTVSSSRVGLSLWSLVSGTMLIPGHSAWLI